MIWDALTNAFRGIVPVEKRNYRYKDTSTLTQTFIMTDKYFFLIKDKVYFRKKTLIDGIGINEYARWKKITKIFVIDDALTAADFIVHVTSTLEAMDRNRNFCRFLAKRFGIDDEFLGTKYCLHRGIDFEIRRDQYYAYGIDDHKHELYGVGPTLLMATANLYFEQSIALNQTFLP